MSSRLVEIISEEDRLDSLFHSLSDRTRRKMLDRLAEGPAVIKELAEPFDMTFAAVSKHLRVLEAANLVTREVDGKYHRCALRAEPLLQAEEWLRHHRAFWEGNMDSLAAYAQRVNEEEKQ